ncbi:MAG: hypothetical protein LBH24_06335 [Clostridiales bacterium]|jgi:hypothetical protein|nr:hypothetical protein [Clostridiales bacterium]
MKDTVQNRLRPAAGLAGIAAILVGCLLRFAPPARAADGETDFILPYYRSETAIPVPLELEDAYTRGFNARINVYAYGDGAYRQPLGVNCAAYAFPVGRYRIRYEYRTALAGTQYAYATVEVRDMSGIAITPPELKRRYKRGEAVALSARAVDRDGSRLSVTTEIFYGAQNTAVAAPDKNAFIPDRAGEYTVRFTASNADGSGDAVLTAALTVDPETPLGLILGIAVPAGAVVVGGSVLLILFLRKRRAAV